MASRTTLPVHEDDGTRVDYLDEDPEVPTQKYCIVSFLSSEKIVKQKEQYFFQKFTEWKDYDWKMKGQEHFLVYIAKKYNLKIDDVLADHLEFEKVHKAEVQKTDIYEQFQVFLLKHEKMLQEQFDHDVGFATNVRGVKLRRSFPSAEEAQVFAQALRRRYPKDNIYIGKVGAWLPWDPSEHLMGDVDYAERDLNEIMRRYKENEANKELVFAEERDASIKRQKAENDKRKKELEDASKPVHPSEGVLRE